MPSTTMKDSYDRFSDVPRTAVRAFAQMLAMSPNHLDWKGEPEAEWLNGQGAKVASLPKCLLYPKGLKGISMKIYEKTKGIPGNIGANDHMPTVLCKTHHGLNPQMTRQVFSHVARELSDYADRVRAHQGDLMTEEVQNWGDRLFGVTALWSDTAAFDVICGKDFPRQLRLPHLRVPCEACILAIIGARGQILTDLRASMLSRMETDEHEDRRAHKKRAKQRGEVWKPKSSYRGRHPTVWYMVEAWIDLFGEPSASILKQQSEDLSRAIVPLRLYDYKVRRSLGRAERTHLLETGGTRLTDAEQRALARRPDPSAETTDYVKTKHGHFLPRPMGRKLIDIRSCVLSEDEDDLLSGKFDNLRIREQYEHVDGRYAAHNPRHSAQHTNNSTPSSQTHPAHSDLVSPLSSRRNSIAEDDHDPSERHSIAENRTDNDGGYDWEATYEREFPQTTTNNNKNATVESDNEGSDAGTYVPVRRAWNREPSANAAAPKDNTYSCESAVPSPLNVRIMKDKAAAEKRTTKSWESASAYTYSPSGTPPRPVSQAAPDASSVYSNDGTAVAHPAPAPEEEDSIPPVPVLRRSRYADLAATAEEEREMRVAAAKGLQDGECDIVPDDSISVVNGRRREEGLKKFPRVEASVVMAGRKKGGQGTDRMSSATKWF